VGKVRNPSSEFTAVDAWMGVNIFQRLDATNGYMKYIYYKNYNLFLDIRNDLISQIIATFNSGGTDFFEANSYVGDLTTDAIVGNNLNRYILNYPSFSTPFQRGDYYIMELIMSPNPKNELTIRSATDAINIDPNC